MIGGYFVSVDPVVWLPIGLLSGLIATLAMDAVMPRLPEGKTPPRVASGVLSLKHPEESPRRLSAFIHYFSGVGTGGLYVYLLSGAERAFGGVSIGLSVLTGVFLYVGMVSFFGLVPLKASEISPNRTRDTLRDWSVCAFVYVVVLFPCVAVLTLVAASFFGQV